MQTYTQDDYDDLETTAWAMLKSFVADDGEEVYRLGLAVGERHGGHAMPAIMQLWIDALLLHTVPAYAEGSVLIKPIVHTDAGRLDNIDEARPAIAWAARLIAARAARDRPQFEALLLAVPADDQGDYCAAVLKACAAGLTRDAADSNLGL